MAASSECYRPATIAVSFFIGSTPFSRTFLSAHSLLGGLYEHDDPSAIPIEVHHQQGPFAGTLEDCPRLRRLLHCLLTGSGYAPLASRMRALEEAARQQWNLTDGEEIPSFFDLADNFFCFACHQLAEPPSPPSPSLDDAIPNEMCSASRDAFRFILEGAAGDREMSKLYSGPLLRGIVNSMAVQFVPQISTFKFTLFSTHDTTIAHLHSALQTEKYYWPPYASSLLVELWVAEQPAGSSQDPEDLAYVRLIYNGDTVRLPWCRSEAAADGALCSYRAFLYFANQVIPTDYDAECHVAY